MRKALYAGLAIAICLSGCQALVTHNTPSGRPEVTITGEVADAAINALAAEMLNRRYDIRQQTKSLLVCERKNQSLGASLMYGSQYDSTPMTRVTWNAVETAGETRVVGTFAVVTNPGSAFERVSSLNQARDTLQYQDVLNRIKGELEAK